MPQPAISVVVPCYNLGAYLDEAVDSVLAQTREALEIIVVNDGSTDHDTARLLADYRRPRTTVLTTSNRGPGAARNAALRVARGDYVCALDADDVLHERFLEKTGAVLDAEPAVAFVSCWLEMFGDQQGIWKQDSCDLVTLLDECTVTTPALSRRSAWNAVGDFDEDPALIGMEDWDLWISLVEAGFVGRIIPEVLFYYRRRTGSLSEFWMNGDAHLAKLQPLLRKHHDSYRQHLLEVMIRKEALACKLLQNVYRLERDIECSLEPLVSRRTAELARLRSRRPPTPIDVGGDSAAVENIRRDNQELKQQVQAAQIAIGQFEHSLSWRLTAPLRAVYDWYGRVIGASVKQP